VAPRILTLVLLLCALCRADDTFPPAASKKGLQVQMVDDAIALGVKHAALNINLTALADVTGDDKNFAWESSGRTYRFRRSYVEAMDRQVKRLSDAGMLVYLILLTYESRDDAVNELVLHPGYDKSCPNHLGAFNSVTVDGRRWLSACIAFLSQRWSPPNHDHGRVVGYIVGNEVNSHWHWSNRGRCTMEQFADDYEQAVRIIHTALRRHSRSSRVYLSMEHHWSIRYAGGDDKQTFPGRPFLERFTRLAKERGDFDWHLAFHPYPEDLFEPRFWRDRSATPAADSPRITFKNLPVLTAFMRRPEMRFGGEPRRIILSEQGFHTPKRPDGEAIQAAAFCHAYRIVEGLDGIDAFILHRHVDHAAEGGLLLGLWSRKPNTTSEPSEKKKIYDCFRLADTPRWREAFEFALPVVGLKSWDEAR
jgi:hypothetical protein